MKRLTLLAAFLTLSLVLGCGDQQTQKKTYKVSGTLVDDNDKPIPDVTLNFQPTGAGTTDVVPHADVDSNGKFELSTYGDKDGIPAGSYTAFISVTLKKPKPGEPPPTAMPKMVDVAATYGQQYTSAASSPLKVTIKEGDNPPIAFKVTKQASTGPRKP